MKKSFVAFIGAILLVLSALNIGVFNLQKSVLTNVAAAGGYDVWDYGPVRLPNGDVCCFEVINPSIGCDPNDPGWGCF